MATIRTQPNAGSDVFAGGEVTFRVQFETFLNSGQGCGAAGVTVSITAVAAPGGGTGTPLPATSAGVAELGEGLFEYIWNPATDVVPGLYLLTWTGDRASDGMTVTYTQAVPVAPDPEAVPVPGCYATVAQYRNRTGDQLTPAARVQVALGLASEDMDVALVSAVYRTGADGMPTDPYLVNILARATAAQCQYVLAVNDDTGIKSEYASTSVAGISQVRAASMQARALRPLCQQAAGILRVEGVLPSSPLLNW